MKLISFPLRSAFRLLIDYNNFPRVSTFGNGKDFLRRNVCLNVTSRQELKEEGQDKKRDQKKDRTQEIPVETSIKYLQSSAFKETYGDDPVWLRYRRNYKGAFPPRHTRKTCIRGGQIATGNPCPICRDEYLVLDHTNVVLLKQFISPHNGEILGYNKTGLCRRKHQELLVAIERAKDRGLITFDVPHREYIYSEYINKSHE